MTVVLTITGLIMYIVLIFWALLITRRITILSELVIELSKVLIRRNYDSPKQ